MSTANIEFEQRLDSEVPHWWVMSIVLEVGKILPRSLQDHGKIVSPCNTVVVCIYYGLICSLVTGMIMGLVHSLNWSCTSHAHVMNCQITKNGLCMFLVTCPSIAHVCPSHITWSHMRDHSSYNVASPLPGQPY